MARDTGLTVSFFGRDVTLSKSLGNVSKNARTTGETLEKMSKKATFVLTAVAGAAAFAAKAAMEDQAASAQLANTLRNVIKANDATVASVEDYIQKSTLATGITDDQLRPAFDRIIRSTKDVGKAQKLTNLAMEIATAKGLDVTTVANALAKAHDGNIAALRRLGISVDDNAIKNKNFAKVIKDLGKEFQGSLAADAETAAGKQRRLANAINETRESIGYALLPFVEKLTEELAKLVPFIEKNQKTLLKVAAAVTAVAVAVKVANVAYKAYMVTTKVLTAVAAAFRLVQLTVAAATGSATAAQTLAEMTYKRSRAAVIAYTIAEKARAAATFLVAVAQRAVNLAMRANPIGLIITAVFALGAALVAAYKKSETFRRVVNGAFNAIKVVAGGVVGFIKNVFVTAFNFIKGYVNIYISAINMAIRLLNKIKFKAPDWLKYTGPLGALIAGKEFSINLKEIPKLAKGGIVNKPTLAMIGEAGPEAVVPLNKGMTGVNVTVNVNGSVIAERDLVKNVRDGVAQLMRRQGANTALLGV